MNINKLKEGMELKSYRELCEVLGIKVKGGNSKKSQMKEIERFIKLSKGEGYGLIVDEIYEVPKPKEINKRNDIYGEMLQLAIMDYLINSKRSKTTATRNYLLGQVEMINQNFRVCNSNRKKFAEYTGIRIEIVNDFFNIAGGNFRRILERSLDELEDKAIIKYRVVTIVKDLKGKDRLATDEEIEIIIESEKIVLNEMDYDKKSDVRISGKWNTFKKKVKEILDNKKSGILYYYDSYEISVNKRFIRDEREKVAQYIIDESERIANRNKLTDTLADNLVGNAATRQEKARKNVDMNKYNKKARITFSYVSDIQKMVNHVINPRSKRITNDMINVDH
jgi:hypothetical protein